MNKVIVDDGELETCDKIPDGYLELDTMDGFIDSCELDDDIEWKGLLEDTMDLEGLLDEE